ncbi:TPA: hypothetical protein EYP38_04745, partial [Candidatus Micrarchaeota archaeon]|nr:hypothetical protein [Candidatus Micrarchaeota archaeon]
RGIVAAALFNLPTEASKDNHESSKRYHSEQEVYDGSLEVAEKCKDALITSRYPKDLDRLRTLYDIAKKTGRTLVISIKTAHLLLALKDDPHISLPDPLTDESIKVYGRQKMVYYDWEKELITKCVNSRYVAKRMDELLFEIDFYTLPELIDLQPKKGDFIHSMSEPFQEDPLSILSDNVLQNWLKHFNLKHHQLHASGHASKEEIFGMIDRVKAKKVIPIHTEHPELFSR